MMKPLLENDWQIVYFFLTLFNYSNSVVEIPEKCEICSKVTVMTAEHVNDVALSLLLAFHIFFLCFRC